MNSDISNLDNQVLEIVIRHHGEGPVRLALSVPTEKLDAADKLIFALAQR